MHLLKALTLAVTVIVMAVPEGLPMMITVVLSANMKRMLKDNVFVRKLIGIETAGSLNILFTDKTGTLTCGKLNVTHFVTGVGRTWERKNEKFKETKLSEILYNVVCYNNSASLEKNVAIGGNATDRSVLEYVSSFGKQNKNIEKTKIIPFSSNNKFMATTVRGELNKTFIKGAPEKILSYCTKYYDEKGNSLPFTSRTKINYILKEFSEKAIRVIAVAVSDNDIETDKSFNNLTLVGLLGIRDEIRKEVPIGISEVLRCRNTNSNDYRRFKSDSNSNCKRSRIN
jgi:magnesium-transporting ATPase (P-type)